jgi:hypothetical protein
LSSSLLLQTLASDSFIAVNKRVLRFLEGDATAALLLSELLAMYRYHRDKGLLDVITDAFPASMHYIEKVLALSPYKQQRVLKVLQEKGLLVSFMQGMPASRWVHLHFEAIMAILEEPEIKQSADSVSFYDNLSQAAETKDVQTIKQATGNMGELLSNAVLLISMTDINKKKWIPKSIGMLKYVISHYNKGGVGFDYKRLERLIQESLAVGDSSIESVIFTMSKKYKGIPETAIPERIYNVTDTSIISSNS